MNAPASGLWHKIPDASREPDFVWLMSHRDRLKSKLRERSDLAKRIRQLIDERVSVGDLPYTIGIFGGWGSGKTTFLALLAEQLQQVRNYRIIYFNSWKYAGFMEIVPALIYKILQYGLPDSSEDKKKAAVRVLMALGKTYSDQFGEWAKHRLGINVVKFARDAYDIKETIDRNSQYIDPAILQAYYTQIDKAQDCLAAALGTVDDGRPPETPVIVLIDELDRCDPDEAFTVIKQMRVLFAMRRIPVLFVVCANPEPIGLAIKQRYGYQSANDDYEARRILEKFVDSYEDLALPPANLAQLARTLWDPISAANRPWVIACDNLRGRHESTSAISDVTAYDIIDTGSPLYANLRVLQKTFQYIHEQSRTETDMLWTVWHLEIANQLYPDFRRIIRSLAYPIQYIAAASYNRLSSIKYRSDEPGRIVFASDKGSALFSMYRSYFWEASRVEVERLRRQGEAQSSENARLLGSVLVDFRRMDFLSSMTLVPLDVVLPDVSKKGGEQSLPDVGIAFEKTARSHLGWLLANY